MGEMSNTIKHHYSRGNIEVLKEIANDTTVDEEDRDLAREYIERFERDRDMDDR